MKKSIGYSICVAIFLFSNMVFADVDPLADFEHEVFDHVNNSFAASFNAKYFNYRENAQEEGSPGNIEDYGPAFGLSVNFRNVFFKRLYTDVYGEYLLGKIQYKGFEQYTQKPLSHRKSNNFADIDTKLGVILLDTKYFQVVPYGGMGFHYWTPDKSCTYYNFKALVGVKVNFALYDSLVLSPYMNIGTTLYSHAKAKVYDEKHNYQGTANHKLGKKPIRELGLEINYKLAPDLLLTGTVSHIHFEYGKSADQYVGNYPEPFVEPNSKTNELRFSIGMRYSFM